MHGVMAVNAQPRPLISNLSFHLLWSSTFFSGLGDRLVMLAAYKLLGIDEANAEQASTIAIVNVFFFLPYVIWGPLAGWLADRLPRKWVMFAADELRGIALLIGWAYFQHAAGGPQKPDPYVVYGLICFVGMMAATFVPAKMSIIPSIVGLEQTQRANAMVVSMGVIGNLAGFIIDGAIHPDVATMVTLGVVAYCGSGLFWVFLKTPFSHQVQSHGANPMQVVRDIGQGMKYAWGRKPVLILMGISALLWTGTSVLQPALKVVTHDLYGKGQGAWQMLMANLGGGMLIGAVVVGLLNPRRGSEVLLFKGLLGCGIFFGLSMVVPWPWLGMGLAFMIGFSASVLLVPMNTLIQQMTADRMRGRVFAAKEMVSEVGQVVVSAVIAFAPSADSWMRWAALALAGVYVALALWGAWRYLCKGPLGNRVLDFLWRFNRLYVHSFHRLVVRGWRSVPHTGGVALVSNHTAGIDPMLLQAMLPRPVRWMMERAYMFRIFNPYWKRAGHIPVDRSKADSSSPRLAITALKEGQIIGIFPEGHLNADRSKLAEFKPGVGLIVRRAGALVVPVWISGTPRTTSILKSILTPSKSCVVFGKPVTVEELQGPAQPGEKSSAADDRLITELRRRIEALAEVK